MEATVHSRCTTLGKLSSVAWCRARYRTLRVKGVGRYARMCGHKHNFPTKTEKKVAQVKNFNLEDFKERGRQEERGRDLFAVGFRLWKGPVCLKSAFIVNVHFVETTSLRISCF